jgi:hypothetical protein
LEGRHDNCRHNAGNSDFDPPSASSFRISPNADLRKRELEALATPVERYLDRPHSAFGRPQEVNIPRFVGEYRAVKGRASRYRRFSVARGAYSMTLAGIAFGFFWQTD